jgi:hypothetical protein
MEYRKELQKKKRERMKREIGTFHFTSRTQKTPRGRREKEN